MQKTLEGSEPEDGRWTATIHFDGVNSRDIRAGLEAIQESLGRCNRGRIERVSLSPTLKRHRNAFDRSINILLDMHKGMSLPHPMTWSMAPTRKDGEEDILKHISAAVAVTTDPDDAKLLTVLTQIVWTKTLARERLRELVVAYVEGDNPGAVIRSLGPNPDPGLDLDAVQSWFLNHLPGNPWPAQPNEEVPDDA